MNITKIEDGKRVIDEPSYLEFYQRLQNTGDFFIILKKFNEELGGNRPIETYTTMDFSGVLVVYEWEIKGIKIIIQRNSDYLYSEVRLQTACRRRGFHYEPSELYIDFFKGLLENIRFIWYEVYPKKH